MEEHPEILKPQSFQSKRFLLQSLNFSEELKICFLQLSLLHWYSWWNKILHCVERNGPFFYATPFRQGGQFCWCTNSNFYYVIGILKLTVNTLLSIFNRDMAKPTETGMCGLVPGSRWYLVRKSSLHLCVGLLLFNIRAGGLAQSIAKGVEGSDGGTDKGAYALLETKDTLTSGNDQTSVVYYHHVCPRGHLLPQDYYNYHCSTWKKALVSCHKKWSVIWVLQSG